MGSQLAWTSAGVMNLVQISRSLSCFLSMRLPQPGGSPSQPETLIGIPADSANMASAPETSGKEAIIGRRKLFRNRSSRCRAPIRWLLPGLVRAAVLVSSSKSG
jgi:hypothetical protein